MKKSDKQFFTENLTAELKTADSFVLIDFIGLGVKQQQELKKRLISVGAKMLVVKNTLLKRAGQSAQIPAEVLSDTVLSGPTALIIAGTDPVAPLQILAKFAAEFEIPQFKVGLVDKQFMDKESLSRLSKLPGRDVLVSQAIGAIASPLYGLVGVLQGNLQKLVYILDQKAKG